MISFDSRREANASATTSHNLYIRQYLILPLLNVERFTQDIFMNYFGLDRLLAPYSVSLH